ncbi:S8 family serine peptidase [Desertibaculum subflavum]|uniref:S8 family serine peptidase n=1 Tax=Desertibaculum subflavum TaxID=2268458 RepID=UPI0013C4D490
MAGTWVALNLAGVPHAVRPETHWLREVFEKLGPLWFSVQASRPKARELHDAFAGALGRFDDLIRNGARMAPASRAALQLTLEVYEKLDIDDTIGTELLVPYRAFPALQALVGDGFAISDAGLAIEAQTDDATAIKWKAGGAAVAAPGAIVAIIDDGVGVAHQRFRSAPDRTRIAHFLDMTTNGLDTSGPKPTEELLARSWTAEQINQLLAAHVEDTDVYRAMGLIDFKQERRQPLRAATSHGTHTLDTAAGEASGAGGYPIIAVQQPAQVAEDRSDAWMPQTLKRALDWILVKAVDLSWEYGRERIPLVLNCSVGSMAGPLDGQSDMERRFTQFLRVYRAGDDRLAHVVLSAGNNLQARAAARHKAGDKCPIRWRVQPDDRTPSYVQIWLPLVDAGAPQQVAVRLCPPRGGPATAAPSEREKVVQWQVDSKVLASIYHQIHRRPGNKMRECITIAIRATADDGDPVPVVPAGTWMIHIDNLHLDADAMIDLRVHRDDPGLFVRRKARQSRFEHPDYVEFDPVSGRPHNDETREVSPVRRQRTLSAYAGGTDTIVVGGYRRSDGEPAIYSSSGPTDGGRVGPDLAAVSEESAAFRGLIGAGTQSGSVALLNGTSVAAPQVTRRLADLLAAGDGVAELIAEVEGFEKAPHGPHGSYKAARPLRAGRGRLPRQSPRFRIRIDD